MTVGANVIGVRVGVRVRFIIFSQYVTVRVCECSAAHRYEARVDEDAADDRGRMQMTNVAYDDSPPDAYRPDLLPTNYGYNAPDDRKVRCTDGYVADLNVFSSRRSFHLCFCSLHLFTQRH